jgi:pyruvate-formate lyase-activating enzyme
VLDAVDVVSMDWKLASDVRREDEPRGAPGAPFHGEHERFLRAAREGAEVVVKLVVTPASEDAELDEALERIAAVDPATPVVLQPVTPVGPVRERPTAERMLALEARFSRRLADVRVVPQTHPIWGAR